MKTLGIIAEYNPFHKGHKYHLNQSLAKTEAEATICIMSGNFLQRGTPALINQFSRAEIALQEGVDLVIQLPVSYTIRSAPNFAFGAVKLLDATGIVDYISFGSESGNLNILTKLAELLAEEPEELSKQITDNLATGLSYPKATAKAVITYLKKDKERIELKKYQQALNSPNNILGIEYLKALNKLDSSILPVTIKRKGSGYHDKKIKSFPSATAIRNKIKLNKTNNLSKEIKDNLPTISFQILQRELQLNRGPIFFESFTQQILTLLRRINRQELNNYEDVAKGLNNRIKSAAKKATDLTELLNLIKTKCYTQMRIQRIIAQILIDLKANLLEEFDRVGGPQYFRVLGFTKKGQKLLSQIKEKADIPIITKVADYYKSNYDLDTPLKKMLKTDITANNIYNLAYPNQKYRCGGSDFRQHPIIID